MLSSLADWHQALREKRLQCEDGVDCVVDDDDNDADNDDDDDYDECDDDDD